MAIQRITSGIIADGAIVATDIGDGVVTASKIADANVTSSKLASTLSISGNFLANNITANTNIVANTGSAAAPSIFPTGDTNTGIFFPAADTIAFAEGGAEAMRIDSSGRVGIGTTSPVVKLQIAGDAVNTIGASYGTNIYFDSGASTNKYIANGFGGVLTVAESGSGGFRFYTAPSNSGGAGANATITERMRIDSTGAVTTPNSASAAHNFGVSRVNGVAINFINASASNPYGATIGFSGTTPNNTTEYFLNCFDTTNDKLTIFSNGTVTNRTGTYNSFSDLKLKQDIVDASSQWDDIKALRVVKYRLKDEVAINPDYPAYIGVIAQEAEQVSPGLIDDCPDFEEVEITDEEGNVTTERQTTGTVTKSVKYSILYMKAVKALQEAMERIETLEAKVAALEESQP